MTTQKKLLVIEDDEDMASLYQTVLKQFGEVRVAASMAQARELLQGVDLILLDYYLEGEAMKFQDLVPELKQHAPVLLCSGVFDPQVPAMGAALGAAGYWNKTEPLENLLQLVRRNLS